MSLVCVHIVLTAQGAVKNQKFQNLSNFNAKTFEGVAKFDMMTYQVQTLLHTHSCCHLS